MRAGAVLAAVVAVAAGALVHPRTVTGYADGPPPAHTGGFGEPTCSACHLDGGEATGRLRVDGVPERYRPGATVRLTLTLEDPTLERAGFELAVRDDAGKQAGTLEAVDERAEVVTGEGGAVQYARHTAAGAEPAAAHRATWSLLWTAPAPPREDAGSPLPEVRFHVAANAANYDDSELGDTPYAAELVSLPAESPPRSTD